VKVFLFYITLNSAVNSKKLILRIKI